tara:strand:+ start:147012 stop:147713 length:702 start_codon:yes stop_codon:yes gene_type:complete
MSDNSDTTTTAAARKTRKRQTGAVTSTPEPPVLQNALELFQSETETEAPESLHTVRVGEDSRFVVPFTLSLSTVDVHYVDYPSDEANGSTGLRGYIRCNDEACVLCHIGVKKTLRHLLPVYDIEEGSVGVLGFTDNVRPKSLRAQLIPALKRVDADDPPFLLEISRSGKSDFQVEQHELPAEAKNGADAITNFIGRLKRGEVSIDSTIETVSNDSLAAIPNVERILSTKGGVS